MLEKSDEIKQHGLQLCSEMITQPKMNQSEDRGSMLDCDWP